MSEYTAIIVEPRQHPALFFVLNNFLDNLDLRWNIIVYCGNKNVDWLKELLKTIKEADRISIIKLDVDNLHPYDYSALMVRPDFIRQIPTEVFLVFQTDTMISSLYKDYIYKFIKYDYVGAPWHNGRKYGWHNWSVGNGGLSLRRKSKMLEIALKAKYPAPYGEDMFFSFAMGVVDVYKPSFEEAREFSIETVYSPRAFGVHKSWNYTYVSEEQCPGYSELVRLNTYL